jgi:membrane fusion protein, multidrug efflux system
MISEVDIKARIKTLIGVALVGALLLLVYEVFYWFTHVYESDVRVQTDFTDISSRVDGKIEKIHVGEGSPVSRGQVIVTLEHEAIKLNINSLMTDLELEKGNRARLVTEREAFEEELKSKLATQRQKIQALEVDLKSAKDRLKIAQKDLARVKVLVGKRLKPESELNSQQDKTLVLAGSVASLASNILVAKREYDQFKATERQLDIISNNIKISEVKEDRIIDEIKKQKLFIKHRQIQSPIDGLVGEIHKYKGEYVEDGVNILMLHDPKLYWVEAYVDESQIRHVRVGQEVLIDLDAYPFSDFYGQVQHIGSVTTRGPVAGSAYSGGRTLGGSVERVPVRISIENPPENITPGMRGDVNIRIYEHIKLWWKWED